MSKYLPFIFLSVFILGCNPKGGGTDEEKEKMKRSEGQSRHSFWESAEGSLSDIAAAAWNNDQLVMAGMSEADESGMHRFVFMYSEGGDTLSYSISDIDHKSDKNPDGILPIYKDYPNYDKYIATKKEFVNLDEDPEPEFFVLYEVSGKVNEHQPGEDVFLSCDVYDMVGGEYTLSSLEKLFKDATVFRDFREVIHQHDPKGAEKLNYPQYKEESFTTGGLMHWYLSEFYKKDFIEVKNVKGKYRNMHECSPATINFIADKEERKNLVFAAGLEHKDIPIIEYTYNDHKNIVTNHLFIHKIDSKEFGQKFEVTGTGLQAMHTDGQFNFTLNVKHDNGKWIFAYHDEGSVHEFTFNSVAHDLPSGGCGGAS